MKQPGRWIDLDMLPCVAFSLAFQQCIPAADFCVAGGLLLELIVPSCHSTVAVDHAPLKREMWGYCWLATCWPGVVDGKA